MTQEEAIEIIQRQLPKRPNVRARHVIHRSGKGMTGEFIEMTVKEEVEALRGLVVDGHCLNNEELTEYVIAGRTKSQADFDRIHEAFSMLCEAIKP